MLHDSDCWSWVRAGACGQLVVEHTMQKGCSSEGIKDLEDLAPAISTLKQPLY